MTRKSGAILVLMLTSRRLRRLDEKMQAAEVS